MSPAQIGFAVSTLGKVLLGISVLKVHIRLVQEKAIDEKVLAEVRLERIITIVSILLIILGFALELPYK